MKERKIILLFILLCSLLSGCTESVNTPSEETTGNHGTVLYAPYPNPLSLSTNDYLFIPYNINNSKYVHITIENVIGDVVCILMDQQMSTGRYFIRWSKTNNDGELVLPGIYVVHLTTSDEEIKKLIEVRD